MSSQANSDLIQYSDFLRLVTEDKVYSVEMTGNKYTVYLKEDVAAVGIDPDAVPALPTPGQTSPGAGGMMDLFASAENETLSEQLSKAHSYYCAPITSDLERLLPLLQEHGVKQFGTPYQQELSPIVSFLVSWLLPMVIMVVLFSFLFRSMAGKMGGGLAAWARPTPRSMWRKRPASPSRMWPVRTRPKSLWWRSSTSSTTRRNTLRSAPSCLRARFWWALRVPVRPCWPRLWPERPTFPSSPSAVPTL